MRRGVGSAVEGDEEAKRKDTGQGGRGRNQNYD